MPTPDQLNACLGGALLALVVVMAGLLWRMLQLQRQQARALETLIEEQRQAYQRQLAMEQARVAAAQAAAEAETAREQAVVKSRQSMADAVATLRQLKRQFG